MALPSLTKSWQGRINRAIAAGANALATNRAALRDIKDSFLLTTGWVDATGAAVVPANMCTVYYSCDSVAAGAAGDGVDRWDADTDLVWANAGSAHSWMVLQETAIAASAQWLISCEGVAANGNLLTLVHSPGAGFTGGSTTARPTATDERVMITGTDWGGTGTTNTSVRFHVWKSSDGTCWRVINCRTNVANTIWFWEKAVSLIGASWANPAVGLALGDATASVVATGNLVQPATAPFLGRGASSMAMFLAVESYRQTLIVATGGQVSPNDLSGEYPIFGCSLISDTAANRGKHGYLNDVWLGLASNAIADSYPAPPTTPSYQFVQFGALVLPGFQTAMLTS